MFVSPKAILHALTFDLPANLKWTKKNWVTQQRKNKQRANHCKVDSSLLSNHLLCRHLSCPVSLLHVGLFFACLGSSPFPYSVLPSSSGAGSEEQAAAAAGCPHTPVTQLPSPPAQKTRQGETLDFHLRVFPQKQTFGAYFKFSSECHIPKDGRIWPINPWGSSMQLEEPLGDLAPPSPTLNPEVQAAKHWGPFLECLAWPGSGLNPQPPTLRVDTPPPDYWANSNNCI